ncbi:MAG TPA: AAA family ATPase, partial [Xanthobacteraceae bacterium]
SDIERKRMFGAAETERLPPAAYTPWETERVYTALVRKARRVIAAGHSAVIDGVFGNSDEREQIGAAAQATNTPFLGLFLAADLAVRLARVEARKHDASDATADVVRRQDNYEVGDVDWVKIDAGGTPEQTLRAAKAALASHAPGAPAPR